MNDFCGSKFWDWNKTWNTTQPDFTPCFENTVLLAIPCLFLWISSIYEIYKFSISTSRKIPWSWIYISKIIVAATLIIIEIGRSGYEVVIYSQESLLYPIFYYSPIVKISSLTLSLFLHISQRASGFYSSGIQFIFWLLLSLYEAVILRTNLRSSGVEDSILFVLVITCSSLVFLQFFLHFFSDACCRISYGQQHSPIENDSKAFPDVKASIPSQLVYHWVSKLLWTGYKSPIQNSDLWDLNRCDRAECLISEFEKHSERSSVNPTAGSIYRNIVKPLSVLFGGDFLWATIYCTSATQLSFVAPQILSLLIDFVQDTNTTDDFVWRGYLYAVLLAVVMLVKAVLFHRNYYIKVRIAAFIKSVLSSAIYRKALKITNAARKNKTTGEIVNLLSVDVQKANIFIIWVNEYWDSPVQIGVAIYFLYVQLGVAVFAGFAVIIALIPIAGVVMKKMQSYQTAQMEQKDERVKIMNEILAGMKILKLYAWEPSFEDKVKDIRNTEISILKKKAILNCVVEFIWSCTPVLVALASFATYVLMGNNLDAKKAFVSLSLFGLLNEPVLLFPIVLTKSVELYVSLRRINDFLNAEEIDSSDVEHNNRETDAVAFENADFSWDSDVPTVQDLNLRVSAGSLVAVVGMVGCGKSSLLSAVLGEMKKLRGRVNVNGKIAYVSQQPWIQNNTFKDNIYFGLPADNHKYKKVLESCALLPDLEILSGGDQTEIGEKGINLSGGQKQRIALARAAYSNADIYLMDDPLSAVDSHVGKHIFEQLIGPTGLLKTKTRILVTHGLTYLPQMDQIIVLIDGKVSESGTYYELLSRKGAFSDFLIQHLHQDKDALEGSDILQDLENVCGKDAILKNRKQSDSVEKESEVDVNANESNISQSKIIEEEIPEVGVIKLSVIVAYIKAMKWTVSVGIVLMFIAHQALSVGTNVWLSIWTSSSNDTSTEDYVVRDKYLSVYGGLGFAQCMLVLFITSTLNLSALVAAKKSHNTMLARIMRAPMSFFETTPLGRIVNRFSSDIQTIDTELPSNLLETMICLFTVLGILVVISWSTPVFLILVVIIGFIYTVLQRFYIRTARQLFRIDSITKSPVFSHFTETLHGVSTIRAYSAQERFIDESETKIDNSVNTTLHLLICRRWLGFNLDLLGCIVLFFSALFCVIERRSISPSIVGLSISYALKISQYLTWFTLNTALLETSLVSVERVCEYSETVQEAEWNSKKRPPENWPGKGCIQFEGYETRYRKNLDLVLRNVTFRIEAGEKIGIVGRTGAGKSSMTLTLFRIIEAASGRILIDGEDISELGLHDIRGRITIIPQDPVLFSGSLRFNLDPFANYDDDKLWKALELAHLKAFVLTLPEGLQHEVAEGGNNLSVGQRQLVCLARAILRKSKILVLDEATASIDLETDDLIQGTIRKEFSDCTVLTIAHRINTIMDSTRVMVLDKGEIVEFDLPQKLLENKSSLFYQFAKDAGLVND